MKSFLLQSSAFLALTACVTEGRTWEDVIDQAILQKSGVDVARMQLRVEWDPFLGDAAPHHHSSVTIEPTSSPTVGPCHEGTVYYQVNMYDSAGNGWDSTKVQVIGLQDQDNVNLSGNLHSEVNSNITSNVTHTTMTHKKSTDKGNGFVTISNTVEFRPGSILQDDPHYAFPLGKIFESTLTRGSSDYADICLLPRRCYGIVVNGGESLDEVTWDITRMTDTYEQMPTSYIQGKAPLYCEFSIPDENGQIYCPTECTENIPEKYAPITKPENGGNPTIWDIIHPVGSKDSDDEQPTNTFQSLFESFLKPQTVPPASTEAPEEGQGFGMFNNLLNLGQSDNGGRGHPDTQTPSAAPAVPTTASPTGKIAPMFDVNNGNVQIAGGLKHNTLLDFHDRN